MGLQKFLAQSTGIVYTGKSNSLSIPEHMEAASKAADILQGVIFNSALEEAWKDQDFRERMGWRDTSKKDIERMKKFLLESGAAIEIPEDEREAYSEELNRKLVESHNALQASIQENFLKLYGDISVMNLDEKRKLLVSIGMPFEYFGTVLTLAQSDLDSFLDLFSTGLFTFSIDDGTLSFDINATSKKIDYILQEYPFVKDLPFKK